MRKVMEKLDQEALAKIVAAAVCEAFKQQNQLRPSSGKSTMPDTPTNTPRKPGRQVYGLKGIEDLFHVSHKTAQKYKDGILKPAVRQHGRKIITDADWALELFASANKEGGEI